MEPADVQMIESSVLDRCIHHGGVVHIKVDKRSPYVRLCVCVCAVCAVCVHA